MMSTDLTFEGSIWLNRSCKGMVMIYGFTLVFQVASRMNQTTEAELVQRGVNSARFDLQEPNNGYVKRLELIMLPRVQRSQRGPKGGTHETV
jgi:hypothetical protein